MVPRARFELATLGLEVLCSIQLSYQGATDDYTLLLANISEVGVVKTGSMFEAVAKCTINKDVK